jgi:N-acetyl-anhydromuramyl-L-alanine amidase AmpD
MLSFMIISADGYHADPGQALDWQTIDEEFSQGSWLPAGSLCTC